MPGVFHKGSASHDRNDDSGVDDSVDWCQEYVATGLSINDECNLIDLDKDKAVFSIFRRTSEVPLYRIIKQPRSARRQGLWSLVTATGLILRRGHDLAECLRLIDRRLKIVA